MDVKEMHIEFDVRIQHINAARKRNFQPEEKDILLNEAVRRYVNKHVSPTEDGSPRFQVNLANASKIRTLIQGRNITSYEYNNDFRAPLPGNLQYLLSDATEVLQACPTSTRQKTFTTVQLIAITLKPSIASSAFYKQVQLSVNGTQILDLDTFLNEQGIVYNGLSSKEELYVIKDFLLEYLTFKGYDVFYETWMDKKYPSSIIIINAEPAPLSLNLKIDNSNMQVITTTEVLPVMSLSDGIAKVSDNRTVWSNQVEAYNQDPYKKSSPNSPLSTPMEGYMLVVGNPSFISKRTKIRYIEKPQRISLILNRNCNLPEVSHGDIVDLAVELAKGWLNSQDLKTTVELNRLQKT